MKKYLKPCAAAAAVLFLCFFVVHYMEGKNKTATKSIFAMDTYMEITAYGRNSEEAVEAAAKEIQRLDELLSTGSEESEVSQLNENKSQELSADTKYLLQRSSEIWEETQGAFDITVYPVMKAWGFDRKEFRVPSEDELQELLKLVDISLLDYDEKTNTLTLPDKVEIDFGGIAKGYTSSRVAQIMREYGIESAKLNLGGNVQLVGAKLDGSAWRIAIKSPDDTRPYLGILSVMDKAVITSGGYERYFEEDGITYHHIIDPETGKPAQNGLVSVTIVCEDGTFADGLSTALYVLGKENAIAFWREHSEEFDAVLLDEDNHLYVTEGIAEDFSTESSVEVLYK